MNGSEDEQKRMFEFLLSMMDFGLKTSGDPDKLLKRFIHYHMDRHKNPRNALHFVLGMALADRRHHKRQLQ